uniref:Ig-like domain-containing protein n=1 Tax=Cyclopterus lumpus TaxID=8103 RepID=A0A8C2WK24_CYCLU
MIFLMLVFLLGGKCTKVNLFVSLSLSPHLSELTGVLGKEVTIKCSHSYAFTNVKYFCKGACLKVLISSRANKKVPNEKYSIVDKGNTFSVTIFHLTADDSGTYSCGIERIGLDTYIEVVLTVIEGDTGQTVRIECTYPNHHENNEKYLCKGRNPFNCNRLIQTTEQERDVVNGRFHIRDNRRKKYFYVNINNLSTDDAGCYWCGSSRTGQRAGYTKLLLSVGDITYSLCTYEPNEAQLFYQNMSVLLLMNRCVCVCACVCVCEFAYAHNNYIYHTTPLLPLQENHGDHHYDEIQMLNQQASSGDALMSVYATVDAPTDQLHYASINSLVTLSITSKPKIDYKHTYNHSNIYIMLYNNNHNTSIMTNMVKQKTLRVS